jgi:beta-glucosidase
VLRLLRTELRYGFTDRPQFDPADSTFSVANRAVALQGALESITLLKNEGNLLPLDPGKIKTIAIIGPDAWPAILLAVAAPLKPLPSNPSPHLPASPTARPDVHVLYSSGPAFNPRRLPQRKMETAL